MAFGSIGSLGTRGLKSANMSSFALTTTATAAAGSGVFVFVAVDNAGTTNNTDEGAVSSFTDSAGGNTWSKIAENTVTSGSTEDGSVVSLWYSLLTNGISSGGTITASFTNNTLRDAAAIIAWNFSIAAGSTLAIEGTPNRAADQGGTASGTGMDVTTSNIECLRIHACAIQDNAFTFGTPTTGWSVTGTVASSGGGAATNQACGAEYHISTGTSDPVSLNTRGPTSDQKVAVYGCLKEIAAAPDVLMAQVLL